MDLQNLAFNVFFHHGYWLNVCSLQNSIKEAAIRGKDQVLLVSKDLKQHKPTSSFAPGCNWGCLDCMPLTHSFIKLVSKDASIDAIIAYFHLCSIHWHIFQPPLVKEHLPPFWKETFKLLLPRLFYCWKLTFAAIKNLAKLF